MTDQLPGFVIAGLYKDTLVLAGGETLSANTNQRQVTDKTNNTKAPAPPEPKKWWLGDNKKNITILIKDNNAVHINDEWLGTLGKLLTACGLNLGDAAIVNMKEPYTYTFLNEQLHPEYMLLFDTTTGDIQLPFAIPNYQVQKYAGCTFMAASSTTLSAKTTDIIKTEKRMLWEKLKIIFNV